MNDISRHMEEVAKHFWGEPSSRTTTELRWGNHGSKAVNLSQGTWYDFENNEGGGVVDLVKKEMPSLNGSIQGFLDEFGILPQPSKKQENTVYDYTDTEGNILYQVVRYELFGKEESKREKLCGIYTEFLPYPIGYQT
mgnify:CR=1 FL=1